MHTHCLYKNSLKNTYIKLPVTNTGAIDYQFIEKHIRELSVYLTVSRLNNYKLTNFVNGAIIFQLFKITDIFTVKNTHSILKSEVALNSGSSPHVTARKEKTLAITYQPNGYYSNDSHNLALYINNRRKRTEKSQLFIVTALYKV